MSARSHTIRGRTTRWGLTLFVLLAALALIAPLLIVLTISFTTNQYVSLPSHGFTWHWWREAITSSSYRSAAWLSLWLAVATVAGDVVIGIPASLALVRIRPRGTAVARLLMNMPLIVPEIMTALGLLTFFSLYGLTDQYLRLYFGHLLITLPFVVQLTSAALYRFDERQEWAAKSLGASGLRAFWYVTVPQIRPELMAGCLFAFIVSWNNAGLSIFLSTSSVSPLPATLYFDLTYNVTPAVVAVSAQLILVSIVAAFFAHRFLSLETVVGRLRT